MILRKYYQYKFFEPLKELYFLISDFWIKNKLFAIENVYLSNNINKKLISFSLYGTDTRYIENIDKCIISYKEIFPDWEIRVYLSHDISQVVIRQLLALNCEIIIMKLGGVDFRYMYWRFLPLDDNNVNVLLIRDIDSIASLREKKMVSDWLNSKKRIHIIRDHVLHNAKIMGGMWGILINENPYGILKMMHKYTKKNRYGSDQLFLEILYYKHKNDKYINDVIHRYKSENPIIIANDDPDFHIGQINLKH